ASLSWGIQGYGISDRMRNHIGQSRFPKYQRGIRRNIPVASKLDRTGENRFNDGIPHVGYRDGCRYESGRITLLAFEMKSPLFSRLLESRGVCFFAGLLTFLLLRAFFFVIDFYNAPSPTEAMVQIAGFSPDYRETKEILGGRYYY